LSRLSIRLRVTIVFAAVMVLVLGAIGVFVYLRFRAELDSAINSGLRSRAADLVALVRETDSGLRDGRANLVGRAESFAEVLRADGSVVDSSAAIGNEVLLAEGQLRDALRRPVLFNRESMPTPEGTSRLLATPVAAHGRRWVVVVGTSTESRDEALTDLLQLLLIGGPVALLLASIAAYGVAAAALHPVEAMRARASEISAAQPDRRLPVPPSDDEVARLGRTLNEMLERLGEALEHERAFVADASHELRTPLAILRTELELALAEGRTTTELREAISSVSAEADRLTQLSEDLLTIAQTERGELPLRRTRVDLRQILESVRRRFARRAQDEGRAIEIVGPQLTVSADPLRLEQAIGSVVDNALRYGAGAIQLELLAAGQSAEIHVRDHGQGFPATFLPRAFERFSRASSGRRDGGSGLGLAIVSTVVSAHGGTVRALNWEGGAEVRFSVPANAPT
jgi:signal transduction histidine kinase